MQVGNQEPVPVHFPDRMAFFKTQGVAFHDFPWQVHAVNEHIGKIPDDFRFFLVQGIGFGLACPVEGGRFILLPTGIPFPAEIRQFVVASYFV